MSAECYWPGDHVVVSKCIWRPRQPMKVRTRAAMRARRYRFLVRVFKELSTFDLMQWDLAGEELAS